MSQPTLEEKFAALVKTARRINRRHFLLERRHPDNDNETEAANEPA